MLTMPRKKQAKKIVGEPDDHPPMLVLVAEMRVAKGPKQAYELMHELNKNFTPAEQAMTNRELSKARNIVEMPTTWEGQRAIHINLLPDTLRGCVKFAAKDLDRGFSLQYVCKGEDEESSIMRLVTWDVGPNDVWTVSNIKEQDVYLGVPAETSHEEMCWYLSAWRTVMKELITKGVNFDRLMPQDLFPHGSKSPFRLKGRTEEDFTKALRAKSRLGGLR